MTSTIYDSSKNTWKIRTINEVQHSNLFIIYLFICYFFPCEFRAKKIAKLLQSKLNCMEELSQLSTNTRYSANNTYFSFTIWWVCFRDRTWRNHIYNRGSRALSPFLQALIQQGTCVRTQSDRFQWNYYILKVSHVFKCFAGLKPQSLNSDKTGQCLLSSSKRVLWRYTCSLGHGLWSPVWSSSWHSAVLKWPFCSGTNT